MPRIYPKHSKAKTETVTEIRQSNRKITLESKNVEIFPANLSQKNSVIQFLILNIVTLIVLLRINCKDKKNTNRMYFLKKKRFS